MNLFKFRLTPILIFIVAISASFIISNLFCLITVSGTSMEPSIMNHEIRIVNKFSKTPDYDIFMIKNPDDEGYIIKRIIGLPGDYIEFKDGVLYRNGQCIKESYVSYTDYFSANYHIPKGCVFIAGDNRRDSYDSRFFKNPYVPVTNIYGKVLH